MRVLCCGDRNWGAEPGDEKLIIDRLFDLAYDTVLVHGAANGADSMCAAVAVRMNAECGWRFTVEPYPADWAIYGKAAGPIRNRAMLSSGIDLVLAFHHDLKKSKGTADMVFIARKAGVPVEVIE